MTDRQIEELAKLFVDIGKIVLGSLVLGFFQSNLDPKLILGFGLIGLTISFSLFKMGITLFKEVRNG